MDSKHEGNAFDLPQIRALIISAFRQAGCKIPEHVINMLRRGQLLALEVALHKFLVKAKLPTGYGKTLLASAIHALRYFRGEGDYLLFLVPRAAQATQAAESIPEELARFLISTKAIEITDSPIRALDAFYNGGCHVFVATIQGAVCSANTINTIEEMMSKGRWHVVLDESHHFAGGEDASQWTNAMKWITDRATAVTVMSATPVRILGETYFNNPDVNITYRHAVDEVDSRGMPAVKPLHLESYHYDIEMEDGSKWTTETLVEAAGGVTRVDSFMERQNYRIRSDYISPLIERPIDRLRELSTLGIRGQILVQTISCKIAQMTCEMIRSLYPGIQVDWVGTGEHGRKDNEAVLKRFCPKKDPITGRRNWTLQVLVNVGIAGEGLDTTDVTEVVFLTPAGISLQTFQTIGRGARTMGGVIIQPTTYISVDSGAGIAGHMGQLIMDLIDNYELKAPGPDVGPPTTPGPSTVPIDLPDSQIKRMTLEDVRKGEKWNQAYEGATERLLGTGAPLTDENLVHIATQGADAALQKHLDSHNNITDEAHRLENDIEFFRKRVTNIAIEKWPSERYKGLNGHIKNGLNIQAKRMFSSAQDASLDILRKHSSWLRQTFNALITDGVPNWLIEVTAIARTKIASKRAPSSKRKAG